ncbi:hypothetical protein H6F90_04540 [Trichocoleus sp. FACHB-591]|uniref:hypothetical protein n=1 Tax=Trichocoleus sp. FACHB-591 TaxID=2692872 RepID=UPI001685E196|nr:hypothetical protein [Trichocoleus sp. FACHB-591]MBD2094419.1 hypothetical protein [Trichocoleus sp. FACHB-591]
MTSQKDQVQTLIAEIDKVLQKPSTRLPWVMSGETTQQRRVLERVRSYLVSVQQRMVADELSQTRTKSNLSTYDIQYQPTQNPDYVRAPIAPVGNSQDEAARQILQVVAQEMDHLRSSLTQPLQADLEALRQQREALVQEIRQLESQRHHYSLAQQQANQQKIIGEFLQVLMGRLQDSLTQQVAQTLSSLQSQSVYEGQSTEAIALGGRTAANQPLLNPGQRVEQLQVLQARSDQLLMNLDSTLSVVFEALQRNVQSYEESLSTGLERMHDLGQQGEVMFTALVSHLAQQLGREASSFLYTMPTPELESGDATSPETATAPLTSISPAAESSATPAAVSPNDSRTQVPQGIKLDPATLELPYAGAELRRESQPPLEPPLLPELEDENSLEDLNLEGLNLADIELEDDLDKLLDVDLDSIGLDQAATPTNDLPDNLTPSTPQPTLQSSAATSASLTNVAPTASELEFLAQLDIALHDQDAEADVADALEPTTGLEDLVGSTSSAEALSAETAESSPADDDLYDSLFGSDDLVSGLEPQAEIPGLTSAASTPAAALSDTPETADLSAALAESTAELQAQASPDSSLSSPPTSDLFDGLEEVASEPSPTPQAAIAEDLPADLFSAAPEPDETVTTLEDFLFADAAEPVPSDENPDLLSFDLPPTQAISPSAVASSVTSSAATSSAAIDSGALDSEALNLEEFGSSFADELDDADPLAELAELLGGAEVVDEQPTPTPPMGSTTPMAPPSSIGFEVEDELLLSERSLQDIPSLSGPDAHALDDTYIPAAPEESLIAIDDDLGDETADGLWLDENVVQQLNEDLFSLEDSNLFPDYSGTEAIETETSNVGDQPLPSSDSLTAKNPSQSPAWDTAQFPEPQDWDRLTLEDFAETLPETLPPVEPEASVETEETEALSNDLLALWEDADLELPADPTTDLTLDGFDLLADSPAIAPPTSSDVAVKPTASVQPIDHPPTELDTQNLTIDDAFMDFLEAANSPTAESSDRTLTPPETSNLQSDEKKKIQ